MAAPNTRALMMFLSMAQPFELELLSYECRMEGTKLAELDRTETFAQLRFLPATRIASSEEESALVEARVRRTLQSGRRNPAPWPNWPSLRP